VSFRLVYNKILTSTTVTIECISWLINVTDYNDARWKPETNFVNNVFIKNDNFFRFQIISYFPIICATASYESSLSYFVTRDGSYSRLRSVKTHQFIVNM
jgi:hypothetical protein